MKLFRCVMILLPLLAAASGPCWAADEPQPILVDFTATWCGACQQAVPAVQQLAASGYDVRTVDVDQYRDLTRQYGVTTIPCYVVIKERREVERFVGPRDFPALKAILERHRKPAVRVEIQGVPRPAWRYEHATGYYRSVVRIECEARNHVIAKGSGALVRWAGRVVVLTARHVIREAERIIVVTATGRRIVVRPIRVDATWDCAVLEIPAGISIEADTIADVELGAAAMFRDGDRLESAGYGADGKLAVNSGLFKGYRRSTATPQGPDDWAVVSGHARPGDSGGPVFNARGRLVGVLWGTDGETVVAVQAGRLHVLLDSAVVVEGKTYQQRAYEVPRYPTPAKDLTELPLVDPPSCCPVAPTGILQGGQQGGDSLLPWRNKVEDQLRGIDAKLDRLANQPAPVAPGPSPAVPPLPAPEPPKVEAPGNALEQKLDDFLHKLPIQGPIVKAEEKQLESPNGLHRIWGALCAIDGVMVLVIVGTLGLVLLGHKIYQKCHADKTQIDAALAKVPGVGPQLAAGFDRLDAFNTATVDPKIQAVLDKLGAAAAEAKAKAEAALQVGTAAAVAATPVVPAAAPVAAGLAAASAAATS